MDKKAMKSVFISYGHARFAPLVERIKRDLEGDYRVFKDDSATGIRTGSFFDVALQNAIRDCDFFLAFLDAHSTRPNSVCLDEIALARSLEKPILPIRFETLDPPFILCRIQWLDLIVGVRDGVPVYDEPRYADALGIIREVLAGSRSIGVSGERLILERVLNRHRSFDFSAGIAELNRVFVGRTWASEPVLAFIQSPERNLFWILGGAGTGKSAFAAHLCTRHAEFVRAVHFCQFDDPESCDPRNVLCSLANAIAIQNEDYRLELTRTLQTEVRDNDLNAMFRILFVNPLAKAEDRRPVAVIVDGIDEIDDSEGRLSQLLQTIVTGSWALPKWFKFIISARPEGAVAGFLEGYPSASLDDARGVQDARLFIDAKAESLKRRFSADETEAILRTSEGNFLYLTYLFEELATSDRRGIDFAKLPGKTRQLYLSLFIRRFTDSGLLFEDYAALFAVLAGAKGPLTVAETARILAVPEPRVADMQKRVRSMVKLVDGRLSIFHRSLHDWLIDPDASGSYHVDPAMGVTLILDAIAAAVDTFESLPENGYFVRHAVEHVVDDYRFDLLERLLKRNVPTINQSIFAALAEADPATIVLVFKKLMLSVSRTKLDTIGFWVLQALRRQRYVKKIAAVTDAVVAAQTTFGPEFTARILLESATMMTIEQQAGKADRQLEAAALLIAGLKGETVLLLALREEYLYNSGSLALKRKKTEEAKAYFGEAFAVAAKKIELAARTGDPYVSYDYLTLFANIELELKNLENAKGFLAFNAAGQDETGTAEAAEPLDEQCRIALAENDLAKAEAYAKRLLDAERKRDATRSTYETRRALLVAHTLLSEVCDAKKDPAAARSELDAAVDIARANEERYPSFETTSDLGILHDKLGMLALRQYEFEQAETHLRECLRLHAKNDETDPSPASREALSNALLNMGDLARATGDAETAKAHYDRALQIIERVHAETPDYRVARQLALTERRVGAIREEGGDVDGAIAIQRQALALLETECRRDDVPESLMSLASARRNLGRLLTNAGGIEEARTLLDAALDLDTRVDAARSTADTAYALALDHEQRAILGSMTHDLSFAQAECEAAHAVATGLAGRFPSLRHDLLLLETVRNLGQIADRKGDRETAKVWTSRQLEMAIQAYAKQPFAETASHLVDAYGDMADLLHATGDLDGADRQLRNALELAGDQLRKFDTPAVIRRFVRIAVLAGRIAMDRDEFDAAKDRFLQALAVLEREPASTAKDAFLDSRISLHRSLAAVCRKRKESDEAKGHYQEALSLSQRRCADRPDDDAKVVMIESLADLAGLTADDAEHSERLALYQKAGGIVEELLPRFTGDRIFLARAADVFYGEYQCEDERGNHAAALAAAGRHVDMRRLEADLAEDPDAYGLLARAMYFQAKTLGVLGELLKAKETYMNGLDYARKAMRLSQRPGDLYAVLWGCWQLAFLAASDLKDLDLALASFREGSDVCRAYATLDPGQESFEWMVRMTNFLAQALDDSDRLEEAYAAQAEALDYVRRITEKLKTKDTLKSLLDALVKTAKFAARLDRFAEASRLMDEAENLYRITSSAADPVLAAEFGKIPDYASALRDKVESLRDDRPADSGSETADATPKPQSPKTERRSDPAERPAERERTVATAPAQPAVRHRFLDRSQVTRPQPKPAEPTIDEDTWNEALENVKKHPDERSWDTLAKDSVALGDRYARNEATRPEAIAKFAMAAKALVECGNLTNDLRHWERLVPVALTLTDLCDGQDDAKDRLLYLEVAARAAESLQDGNPSAAHKELLRRVWQRFAAECRAQKKPLKAHAIEAKLGRL